MRSVSVLSRLLLIVAAFAAAGAYAAPVTFVVTPQTITTVGGCTSANGCTLRAYQACSITAQTVGALIGTATAGTALPGFTGDTSSPPTVCIRAENAGGNGAFANVTTLTVIAPPGSTTTTYICSLSPTTGGVCVAQ